MRQNLRVRVGAVVLALATLAAIVFAWLNFLQRSRYDLVDDGVAWSDGLAGVEAWKVAADSPRLPPLEYILATSCWRSTTLQCPGRQWWQTACTGPGFGPNSATSSPAMARSLKPG